MAWLRKPEAIAKSYEMLFQSRYSYTFDGIPLVADGLSYRQKMNLMLAGVDMMLEKTHMLSLPPVIQIEPTNTCNLRCPLCPTGSHVSTRSKGFMSMKTFQNVLDELGDTLVAAYLFGFGEPFLHEDMPRMIKALTNRGIYTLTSTNGHFLQTFDEAMGLISAGLKTLIIALDGSDQKTYGKYRINGDIEKVKQCAIMVEAAKKALGSPYPYTVIRTVVTKENESDLSRIEQMAETLGVNMFSYKSLGCLVTGQAFEGFLPSENSFRRFGNAEGRQTTDSHLNCPFPFRQPVIFWDGTVCGCEYDYTLNNFYGKLGQSAFREIWNSENAIKLRTAIHDSFDLPGFCRQRCPYRNRERNTSELYCKEFRKIDIERSIERVV